MWSLTALLLAVLGFGELEHRRASRRRLGTADPSHPGPEAVVVLDYRNPGDRINLLNRWRVRAGRPEAELMAD